MNSKPLLPWATHAKEGPERGLNKRHRIGPLRRAGREHAHTAQCRRSCCKWSVQADISGLCRPFHTTQHLKCRHWAQHSDPLTDMHACGRNLIANQEAAGPGYATALENARSQNYDAAAASFEELLHQQPGHVKAWISYAQASRAGLQLSQRPQPLEGIPREHPTTLHMHCLS